MGKAHSTPSVAAPPTRTEIIIDRFATCMDETVKTIMKMKRDEYLDRVKDAFPHSGFIHGDDSEGDLYRSICADLYILVDLDMRNMCEKSNILRRYVMIHVNDKPLQLKINGAFERLYVMHIKRCIERWIEGSRYLVALDPATIVHVHTM